ncbi:MAG: DUF86 domain-containing protein [Bacteroidales bacterium]|nr:DUF86 domain-containing protein [Bacteroidales bacterium]
MDEKILKWLYDISTSIDEINIFFEDKPRDFFEYQKNIMLKRAVERNLEIIGEAVNRILKIDETFIEKISNAKAIIGLRNYVIHAYDNVSDKTSGLLFLNIFLY